MLTKAHNSARKLTQAHKSPRQPTTTDKGQCQPTTANHSQESRITKVNTGQRRPRPTPAMYQSSSRGEGGEGGSRRVTSRAPGPRYVFFLGFYYYSNKSTYRRANEGPQRLTKANAGPRQPTQAHDSQRRPTITHESRRGKAAARRVGPINHLPTTGYTQNPTQHSSSRGRGSRRVVSSPMYGFFLLILLTT